MRTIYINSIHSCKNAIKLLEENHSNEYESLLCALESINLNSFLETAMLDKNFSNTESRMLLRDLIRTVERHLITFGWEDLRRGPLTYNGISVFVALSNSKVDTLLFSTIPKYIKTGETIIPIILSFDKVTLNTIGTITPHSASYEFIAKHLNSSSPLPVTYPFLFACISLNQTESLYNELDSLFDEFFDDSKEYVNRSIEFPSEYYQAGLGILSYFSKILKEKYPSTPTNVKIIQEGFNVRMIVETDTGHTEIIEKALIEYQQIINGEIKPEVYLTDQIQILELKTEIRILKARLESQADIISLQNNNLSTFTDLLKQGFAHRSSAAPHTINISPVIQIDNHITQQQIVQSNINQLLDDLEELKPYLQPDSETLYELDDIQGDLIDISEESTQLKKNSLSQKFTKFITKIKNAEQGIDKTITIAKDGLGIITNILKHYNYIATVIGLPTIDNLD
ncbi:hypothetical protein [Paenibacillus sp. FSL H3-0302]|uniref:hypothetical protein n=1 Tax=Paenibacillus sp. FSL H3-0302 TaxID=2921428 RepID=UPI0030ECB57F